MHSVTSAASPRVLIALVVTVAALVATGPGLASADDNEGESDSLVLLEPGYNFVGWISESTAVGDVFEAIPEIEVIYSWDVVERGWRWAAPGVPSRFWTLDAINPGMAVVVWNGSPESVPWIAQTEPALATAELHQGTNWVSWAGPSGWSVDDVVRGIGQSLLRINVGDHDALPAQIPEELRRRSMLRGDPMVVEVARDVPWLQPTGSLPKISFFGNFSEERQQYYTDIVQEAVGFFGTGFGLEADPNVLEVWIFERSVLDSELSSEVREVLTYHMTRNVATATATRIVFPVSDTPVRREASASVMLHEYLHAIQQQLAGSNFGSAPVWMTEGQATWMAFKHDFTGPANPWQYYIEQESGRCGHVTLQAAQHPTFGCEYVLGVLATRLLDEAAGAERLVEFWRQMVPRQIGPNGRWDSASRWQDAFALAFGLTPNEFYGQYDEQRSRPTSETPPDSDPGGRTVLVEGYVQDGEGSGVAGVRVALEQSSGPFAGYVSSALTNADGQFLVEVFRGESQRAQLFPLKGCGYWIGESDATVTRTLAREFTFPNPLESSLNLELAGEYCRRIEGMVVSPEFGPLAGVHVWTLDLGDTWRQSQRTSADGSFVLSVPREGSYRIGVALTEGCSVFYRLGAPAGDWQVASDIRVSASDVTGIHVEIPPDACILP